MNELSFMDVDEKFEQIKKLLKDDYLETDEIFMRF